MVNEGASPRLVILTGVSGAGKTTALQALEDSGYFTVDNLPPALWSSLVARAAPRKITKLAIGVDVRTRAFLDEVEAAITACIGDGLQPSVLFLDASDDTLIRRFSLTRRTHPIGEGSLLVDLGAERRALEPLRSRADTLLDTSTLTARELRRTIQQLFSRGSNFRLRLLSFGFKRGIPIDADNIFDVRSLPNPYYDPDLRSKPGTDHAVQAFIFSAVALDLYTTIRNLARSLARLAVSSGRTNYTLAVGCTGGQHRSVAVVERLSFDLSEGYRVIVEHRDLETALMEHGT